MVTVTDEKRFTNKTAWRLEPSHRAILGWIFVKCYYFSKPCCNYVFQYSLLSTSKKEKGECDFHSGFFCFYDFWLRLVLRGCLYGSRYIGQRIYRLTDRTFSMLLYERTKVITRFGWQFNPIQDGLFRGCSRMEGGLFWPPLPKIRFTYPTVMKLGRVIPYLRKIQKMYKSCDTSLEFCWHQHFFTGNQQILLHQEIHI